MDKRKVLIGGMIAFIITIISVIVFAATSSEPKNYGVKVVKDGSEVVTNDDYLEFKTKVIEENDTDITVETSIKNNVAAPAREFAFVIDNSFSMGVNTTSADVVSLAQNVATEIWNEVDNVTISVTNSYTYKGKYSNTNATYKTTYLNYVKSYISALGTANSKDLSEVIDMAMVSGRGFSTSTTTEKHMIIFTDATDDVQDKVNALADQGIIVHTILADITSSKSGNHANPVPANGSVWLMKDINVTDFVDNINKVDTNIEAHITFDDDILKRGNFAIQDLSESIDGVSIVQNTDKTFTIKADKIKAGKEIVFKYKLTVNTTKTIGSESFYNDINLIKKMTVDFNAHKVNDRRHLEINEDTEERGPIIQLCDAYRLVLNAFGKDSEIPAKGVKFTVIGRKEGIDQPVFEKTGLEASKTGEVDCGLVKELDDVSFTITPTYYPQGFTTTQSSFIVITNTYDENGGSLYTDKGEDVAQVFNDVGRRQVNYKVEIELQTFTIRVDMSELNYEDTKLPGVEFRLIQPKMDTKYEMDALYETTGETGTETEGYCDFKGAVMYGDGEYEYVLSQMTEKPGYYNVGNATIRIHFTDDGKVAVNGVNVLYNSYVTGKRVTEDFVLIKVTAKPDSSRQFKIKINLKDENNEPINGTMFKVVTKSPNGAEDDGWVTYQTTVSPVGEITFNAMGADDNYVAIEISDTGNNPTYKKKDPIEIIIQRKDGIIKEITSAPVMPVAKVQRDKDEYNQVNVYLTAEKKEESNVVRIHLTDKDDTEANMPGVAMTLKDVTPNIANHREWHAIVQSTGFADFILDAPGTIIDNDYIFEVKVDTTPDGYYDPTPVGKLKVTVENGKIVAVANVTDLGTYAPIVSETTKEDNSDDTIKYLAYADYVLTPDMNKSAKFRIKLVDADNTSQAVPKGKYQIRMERNGEEINTYPGKITDATGFTVQMTVPGVSTSPVTVIVSQIYNENDPNGYKIDNRIYQFVISKSGSTTTVVSTEYGKTTMPDDISPATASGNVVTFVHKNKKIDPGDIAINLTITEFDWSVWNKTRAAVVVGGVNLKIWSDEFKIYDETTGNFEIFDENNAYNPFTTGISEKSNIEGQVALKIRPIDLKEVTNLKVDGNDTDKKTFYIAEYDISTGLIIPGTQLPVSVSFAYSTGLSAYRISGLAPGVLDLYYPGETNWTSEVTGTGEGLEQDMKLGLFTNRGETAGIGFDLFKEDLFGNQKDGAKYDIQVVSTNGRYTPFNDVNVLNDAQESILSFIPLKKDYKIIFKETKAPIGYEKAPKELVYTVTNVNESTNTATFSAEGTAASLVTIGANTAYKDADGNTKMAYKVTFKDAEKNSLRFGITTKDKDTNVGTSGNSYKFDTDTLNSATSGKTDNNGYVLTLIGSQRVDDDVTYTITQNLADETTVSQYYKRLAAPIKVKAHFDEFGNIVNDPSTGKDIETLCKSVDSNYGKTWKVTGVNGTNKIDILILQEREAPLTVNIKTVSAFDGSTLANTTGQVATYAITPTVTSVYPGTGTTQIQVGFVDPLKTVTYKVKTTQQINYVEIPDLEFSLTYDSNGYVTADPSIASNLNDYISARKTGNQVIELTIKIEPAVSFAIHNKAFFGSGNLQNAKFEVIRADNKYKYEADTNSSGNAVLYLGKFGQGSTESGNEFITYLVRQKVATNTYATVEEFNVVVEFDQNRNIVSCNVADPTDSTNKFVTTKVQASTNASIVGYNYNNKGIADITILNYPAFNIEITNIDRNAETYTPLDGAKFAVESSILKYPLTSTDKITAESNLGTDTSGIEMIYVDRTTLGTTATYEIRNTQASKNYQLIKEKIKLEVDFDDNGYINLATSNPDGPVRIVEGSEYAEVELYNPPANDPQKFGIKLIIKSTTQFRIDIDNIDRADYVKDGTRTDLQGAKYTITSTYNTSGEVIKQVGTASVYMGETPINDWVTYTIHEENPAVNYQAIPKDIKMKVHFGTNGEVDDVSIDDAENKLYSEANLITSTNPADKIAVKLDIRNNPFIKMNINKIDENGDPLSNIKFTVTGKVKDETNNIFEEKVTTQNGVGECKIDKALENETIIYTIHETKNRPGYKYMDEDVQIEITYDATGRIAKDRDTGEYLIKTSKEYDYAKLANISEYGFDINITNYFIEEIGVKLTTIDKYDPLNKFVEQAEIEAYFIKDAATYDADENHKATFITGREDNSGNLVYDHGVDYQTFGKADSIYRRDINGRSVATLILKETKAPTSYYDIQKDVSKDNIYMSWSKFYNVHYARIDIIFDDEGKIVSKQLRVEGAGYEGSTVSEACGYGKLGKLLDGQYLRIRTDSTNPYLIDLELSYYPTFEVQINAKSDSAYERAVDENDNTLIGTYRVQSKLDWNDYGVNSLRSVQHNKDVGLINAGYIGTDHQTTRGKTYIKTMQSMVKDSSTNEYVPNNIGIWPGETSTNSGTNSEDKTKHNERIFYIYEPNNLKNGLNKTEKSEPQNVYADYEQLQYQQHGPRDGDYQYTYENNDRIATLSVRYKENGEIESVRIIDKQEKDKGNGWTDYIKAEVSDNLHGVVLDIEFKRTTTVVARVVDSLTDVEIKDVTLTPVEVNSDDYDELYRNNNYNDLASYVPHDLSNGENTWRYWGGNDANGSVQKRIKTKYNNRDKYNGYDIIGDVSLDIHYDEYGYIDKDSSRVTSLDANGNPNAIIEDVDKDKIYIKILANRSFNVRIDKLDTYDSSKELKNARFTIKTSKADVRKDEKDNKDNFIDYKDDIKPCVKAPTSVGLIHPSEKVTYRVEETYTPDGYIPMVAFNMDVMFNDDGTIKQIKLEDGTVIYDDWGIHKSTTIPIRLISVADRYEEIKPENVNDIRFELWNEPQFKMDITVKDQFYRDETLSGVTYAIKNVTKNINATEGLTTGDKGTINTYVGSVYPNEKKIEYTITQNNTKNGYYAKKIATIKIEVDFNATGYIESYKVTQGNDDQLVINQNKEKRGFDITIYNKPKDIKFAVEKYDENPEDPENNKLQNVKFQIKKQQILPSTTSATSFAETATRADGLYEQIVDTFGTVERQVLYTITETQQLPKYRKIEDIVIRVVYNADGSINYYNVESNPSEVKIEKAVNKLIETSDGYKAHFKFTIGNDDTYDLIVKDEDKNVAGLGIEGTKYNVYINGNDITDEPEISNENVTTNENGIFKIKKRHEAGDISIKVSEDVIGEGYKENIKNSADLLFKKGSDTYTLELDEDDAVNNKGYTVTHINDNYYDNNYKYGKLYEIGLNTEDILILGVYEGTGKITYTFKNDSKQTILLTKADTNKNAEVKGAKFTVEYCKVDKYGNPTEDPTTLPDQLVSGDDGKVSYELQTPRPINERIMYTFNEDEAPNGGTSIGKTAIIYTYDEKGLISDKEIVGENKKRIKYGNSDTDIDVTIINGKMDSFSVKIVSIDSRKGASDTNEYSSENRINGSTFNVKVENNNVNLAEKNGIKTARQKSTYGYQEDGIIILSGMQAEGRVTVDVNQTGFVDGFIKGSENVISGIVSFDINYVQPNPAVSPEIEITNLNNGGFEGSRIDVNNDQIIIYVKNDPQVKMHIHKQDITTEKPIEGATFTIKAVIDGEGKKANTDLGINVHTSGTDSAGEEFIVIGAPEYGKTVIYTITEDSLDGYYPQENPMVVKVTYDSTGYILSWEVMSDESEGNLVSSIYRYNNTYYWKDLTKQQKQALIDKGKIEGFPVGEVKTKGTRTMNTILTNKAKERVVPYTIIIKTVNELGVPIPGIELDLTLEQENGGNPTFPVPQVTGNDGTYTYNADGSGELKATLNILSAKGYTIMDSNFIGAATKDKVTGAIVENDTHGFAEPKYGELDKNGNPYISLVVRCYTLNTKYSMAIYKMDKSLQESIQENPATFTIKRVDPIKDFSESDSDDKDTTIEDDEVADEIGDEVGDETGAEVGDETGSETGDEGEVETEDDTEDTEDDDQITFEKIVASKVQTDENGMLLLENLDKPEKDGKYIYRFYEDDSPKGYVKPIDPFEIEVTFETNIEGERVITNIETIKGDIEKINSGNNGFVVGIYDQEEVDADQYMLNIYKVDGESDEKVNGALFKILLPDENDTYVFSESGENTDIDGQLDYCYPEEGKDKKDVKLRHMPRPTIEEVKAADGGILEREYTFEEYREPNGYARIDGTFKLTLRFEVVNNESGEEIVQIKDATSSNEDILKVVFSGTDQVAANIYNSKADTVKAFTVHYEDGVDDETIPVPGDQAKLIDVPLILDPTIPTWEGHTFKEWSTLPAGESGGMPFNPGGTYTIDADLVLYAIWEDAEYTITYHENAPIDEKTGVAVGLVENMPYEPDYKQSKTHGKDIILDNDDKDPVIPNVKEYYEFAGWNTKADGSGEHYDAKANYEKNEDMDLYAEWNYIINYIHNLPTDEDGFPRSSPQKIPNTQKDKITSTDNLIIDDLSIYTEVPKAEGYVFKEWNTQADGKGETYNPNDEYKSRKGIDLYAIWEYEIIYDENKPVDEDGFNIEAEINNMPSTQKESVGNTITITSQEPTIESENYIFEGWNTKPDGSGDSYKADQVYDKNIGTTLYAIWVDKYNKPLYLKSKVYIIGDNKPGGYKEGDETVYQDGDHYILGIMPRLVANTAEDYNENNSGTTIDMFKHNIETNAKEIRIYSEKGEEITNDNALVCTSYKLKLTKDSDEPIEVTLIVRGDFKDGYIKLNDYNQFGTYLSKGVSSVLNTEAKLKAFDVNLDGRINMRDYNLIASALSKVDNRELK